MTKKQRRLALVLMIVLVLLGLLLMVYPLFSSWYSNLVSSEVYSEYHESMEHVDTTARDKALEEADEYNKGLVAGVFDPLKPEENNYFNILDLTGNGIIGYIRIPSIDVNLAIYHGTSDKVLKAGAGHMPTSSFPVGGDTTHAVLTAHSGMASNPMFSDITLLEIGDYFQVEVLGEILTYEIQTEEDINIVDPSMIDNIQLEKGQDLCTLITCYPFGVNTHRYLVRGHRIPTPEEVPQNTEDAEDNTAKVDEQSVWRAQYWRSVKIGACIGIFLIVLFIVVLTIRYIRRKTMKRGRFECHR